MRLPRVRFTVLRIVAAVAVTALVLRVAANPTRHDGITDRRVVIPVASAVSAAYGVLAMRRPWMSFLPLLAVWVASPQVDHPITDVINVSAGGCYVAWVIGAPVGWVSRCLMILDDPSRLRSSPPTWGPSQRSEHSEGKLM